MTDSGRRPLLFLDVDGPLIPFGASAEQYPDGYPTYRLVSERPDAFANPLLARVDPAHGARLAALGCDVVWATTWMHEANESVSPRIGLARLPVVTWPESVDGDAHAERAGLHWKTRALVAWAAGRPFVWVDDEIGDGDRGWVAAHHPAPALLHRVDAVHGLTAADYAVLGAWVAGL
ncbi:hypothetical protein B4N89_43640 [Embleya scabrispora]|uniref:Secreted protein n=1 Tax=Embleya scabrispora TaxID=159449 RepID=A0A1T3NKT1_9ACTN|nr:HAD domain-containing protein [Embleya scabrispora]OPC77404.1 hypothetical protein B4N89_43640 [Embleya scabrispora]